MNSIEQKFALGSPSYVAIQSAFYSCKVYQEWKWANSGPEYASDPKFRNARDSLFIFQFDSSITMRCWIPVLDFYSLRKLFFLLSFFGRPE